MTKYWVMIDWPVVISQLAFAIALFIIVGLLQLLPPVRKLFNQCYDTSLRVFQFPFYAFDLLDKDRRPDHGKIVPFIVVMTWNFGLVINMIVVRAWPPVVLVVGVMSLSFLSANVFRWFIKQSQFTAADSRTVTDSRTQAETTTTNITIVKARDGDTGEPGPTDPLQAPKP